MIRKMILFILFLFILITSTGKACDSNLIDLLSSTSRDAEFRSVVMDLASLTRGLGQSVSNRHPHQEHLKSLMKGWIRFSNKYGQTPPIFAKDDRQWSSRMGSIADSIGIIQRELKAERVKQAHEHILVLAGNITQLFAGAELEGIPRLLFRVAEDLDRLTMMAQKNDSTDLDIVMERMRQTIASITIELPSGNQKIPAPLAWRLKQLHEKMLGPGIHKPFSPVGKMMIEIFRDEFATMNEALLQLQ